MVHWGSQPTAHSSSTSVQVLVPCQSTACGCALPGSWWGSDWTSCGTSFPSAMLSLCPSQWQLLWCVPSARCLLLPARRLMSLSVFYLDVRQTALPALQRQHTSSWVLCARQGVKQQIHHMLCRCKLDLPGWPQRLSFDFWYLLHSSQNLRFGKLAGCSFQLCPI